LREKLLLSIEYVFHVSAIWESANWTRQFGIRQTGNRQFGMLPFCLATFCVDLNSLRNIRYPAEWTGVNVPNVFRMKIKISKSRLSLLISGITCLNLLKNKIFQIKIWSLASENTWSIFFQDLELCTHIYFNLMLI
jgi:hypothetical protein